MKRKYRILKNNQTNRFRAEFKEWWLPVIWLVCDYDNAGRQVDYFDLQQAIEAVERHRADRWVFVTEV